MPKPIRSIGSHGCACAPARWCSTCGSSCVRRPPGVKEILLTADPRLQWLPKRGEDSLIADVEQTPITNDQAVVGQRIRLELSRPIVKEETVEVSFLLTGGAGVGNMRRPELRLADETPGLRLFAYSVDPLLESSVSLGTGLKPVAVPEFLKAWGRDTLLPQAAYDADGDDQHLDAFGAAEAGRVRRAANAGRGLRRTTVGACARGGSRRRRGIGLPP